MSGAVTQKHLQTSTVKLGAIEEYLYHTIVPLSIHKYCGVVAITTHCYNMKYNMSTDSLEPRFPLQFFRRLAYFIQSEQLGRLGMRQLTIDRSEYNLVNH